MSVRILKYELSTRDGPGRQIVDLPIDAQPMSVGTDGHNSLFLWARTPATPVIFKEFKVTREIFGLCWTGADTSDATGMFLGTVRTNIGLVWHVFHIGSAGYA